MKKLFKKEQLTVRKIKMMNNCVFATFGNEEERQRAMERLKQCKFKGTYLDVKVLHKIIRIDVSYFFNQIFFVVGQAHARPIDQEA